MRCFIGVELPEFIKDEIIKISKNIDGKRVERENLHITIKFLGDIEEPNKIVNKLSFLSEYTAFKAKLNGIGFFPSEKRPRVIWVGLISSELVELMKNVDDALFPDFKKERNYVPHITIARVKKTVDVENLKKIGFLGEIVINKITMFKSRLFPSGPVYSKIHTWLLK